jgi:hypothetical protein
VEDTVEAILNTDPDKIRVEDVCEMFKISRKKARFYCECAVRQGYFEKYTSEKRRSI